MRCRGHGQAMDCANVMDCLCRYNVTSWSPARSRDMAGVVPTPKYPTMEDKMKTLQQNQEEALAAHKLARSRMADRQKLSFTPFKKGDQVWLDSQNLKTIYHKKMKPKQEGPFIIIITDMLGPVTY